MKTTLALLILCFSNFAFAITEYIGGMGPDNRSACEHLLLTYKSKDSSDEIQVQSAAAELLMWLIQEHPVQLALTKEYAQTKEADLQRLFHLSGGAVLPVEAPPWMMGWDRTGRSSLLGKESREFKAMVATNYQSRDEKWFAAQKEPQRRVIASNLVYQVLTAWSYLGRYSGFSLDENKDYDIPKIEASGPIHWDAQKKTTQLNFSGLRGPSKAQLYRLETLREFFHPRQHEETHFSLDLLYSLDSIRVARARSESATKLAIDFLANELPGVMRAREEVYKQARGETSREGTYREATQDWFLGSSRREMRDKILQLAKGQYRVQALAIPEAPPVPVPLAPLTYDELVQLAETEEGIVGVRYGMRALDLLMDKVPQSDASFAFLRSIQSESELRRESSRVLSEMTQISETLRKDFETMVHISEEAKKLAPNMSESLDTAADTEGLIRGETKQDFVRKEELISTQISYVQTSALIEARLTRQQRLVTIAHQLQALLRQYKYQVALGSDASELGNQIVAQIAQLSAKDSKL